MSIMHDVLSYYQYIFDIIQT